MDFLEIEKQKLELLKKDISEENDDCRHFALSLVPMMKKMTPMAQHHFRTKVQQLAFESLYTFEPAPTQQYFHV